ncbi:MAG: hypothetical protein PVG27_00280 [Chloroflexota bacterium]
MIEQILQADRYLQVDQTERARVVYQRVIDMDPGNAIAVVGLARCALADGDDLAAYELAGRALEIDPENDMARRMEARLSEILANRGQKIERPAVASTPSPREMRPVVTEEPPEPSATPEAQARAAESAPTPPAVAGPPTDEPPTDEPPTDEPPSAGPPSAGPATPKPLTDEPAAAETPDPKMPAAAKEQPVRKSLFDRLLGR